MGNVGNVRIRVSYLILIIIGFHLNEEMVQKLLLFSTSIPQGNRKLCMALHTGQIMPGFPKRLDGQELRDEEGCRTITGT